MAGPSKPSVQGGAIIAKNYHLLGKIGEGSFGVIFLGKNIENREQVAIKIEAKVSSQPQTLLEEARLLKALHSTSKDGIVEGFPRVLWYGKESNNNILVVELLGANLDQLLHKVSGKFSLKTVVQLANQMIDRIKFVHVNDYVHRDIKPENFLMGRRNKMDKVYLIDLGLAKRFRDQHGKHFPFRQMENREITGTTRYASINAHKGMELSRRDDLESLGYVLLYFCKGSLPWQGLQARNDQERYKLITESKLSISVECLCHELPDEFSDYLNYCKGLKYEEEPNYDFIKGLFKQLASKIEIEYDGVFDWSQKAAISDS